MVRAAQATYEQQLINKFRANPKALYGYMRYKSKSKQKVVNLLTPDSTPTTSDKEAAKVLNSFFQSLFISESDAVLFSIIV